MKIEMHGITVRQAIVVTVLSLAVSFTLIIMLEVINK